MRMLALIALICVFVFVGLLVFIRKTVTQVNACMESYETNMFSQATRDAIQQKDKRTLCALGQTAVVEMKSCVDLVLNRDSAATVVIKGLSTVKPELDAVHFVELHNNGCSEFPEYLVR